MRTKIIIIAANKIVRDFLSGYFEGSGYRCLTIDRDRIIADQQLVITENSVAFCGQDLIGDTAAAIILDSGFMWPQPVTVPSVKQWAHYRNNLDEYLRNEREAASIWYSLLEILNDSLPICINPQEAFTAETFKPWALDILSARGVPAPPFLAGNNREQIAAFMARHPGPFLSLPVSEEETVHWDWQEQPDRGNSPVFIQAFTSKEEIRVLAANGKVIQVDPKGASIGEVIDHIPRIQSCLKLHLAELVFRHSNRQVLSDFKAAPELTDLDDQALAKLLDEIDKLIRATIR